MSLIKTSLLLLSITISPMLYAAEDQLTGLWRSIDDKTGFSKGIVEISKDKNGIYNGKIVEVIPRPGYTPKTHCVNCSGDAKGQPIVGLRVLSNMKPDPKKPGEYFGGTILDPLTGKLYKSRIKLNSTGSRLTMRGFVGIEVIGRSQTWIKHTN